MNQLPDPNELYAVLRGAKGRAVTHRLTYRCPRRCTLLDAFDVPAAGDILLYEPSHKYSPQRNERRTAEAARQDPQKTRDGNRRWKGRAYWLSNSGLSERWATAAGGVRVDRVMLRCDHVDTALTHTQFWEDWRAGRAEQRVMFDGTRQAP